MKKIIDEFIIEHSHVEYCEAIIHKNGLIEYAIPNHVESMLRITNKDKFEIYNMMNILDSPLLWLINYTNTVCVWYKGYILPSKITKEQKKSLDLLIKHNLIKSNNFGI